MIEKAARGQRARIRIGEGQEIVAHKPDEMRRRDGECDGGGDIGSGREQRAPRFRIEQEIKRERTNEDRDEIFRP